MSAYIKSIDPNHLVLLGHSGVFGASTPDLCALPPTVCGLHHPCQIDSAVTSALTFL